MNKSETAVSVFMPFYNEEEVAERTVKEAVELLSSKDFGFELILVDDGSQDRTREILEDVSEDDERIRTEIHRQNRGYGEALKTGFQSAENDLVFYTDGDAQFDINEIDRFLEEIEDADMVVGYRKNREDSFSRELTSEVFNMLARSVLPIEESDIDCAFKMIRKQALEGIELETKRTVDAELLAKSRDKGKKIKEVPVRHLPREAGDSEAEGVIGVRPGLIVKSVQELIQIRRSLR